MFRKSLGICMSLAFPFSLAAAVVDTASQSKLTAAAIVDKNVAARGGLQAWRTVQTLSLAGKMGAGGNQRSTLQVPVPGPRSSAQTLSTRPAEEVQLPFVMELKRPRKMRFEFAVQRADGIQVFDGANGWKLRPYLNRVWWSLNTTEK